MKRSEQRACFAVSLIVASCSPHLEDLTRQTYCEAACGCATAETTHAGRTCTVEEMEACDQAQEEADQLAGEIGCSEELDDWMVCVQAHMTCEPSGLSIDGCDAEDDAYIHCVQGDAP